MAVAVPACNEARLVGQCLVALAKAAAAAEVPVTVVVLVNNSLDDTVAVIRRTSVPTLRVVLEERQLPPDLAHAGGARRAALDIAAALLPADGVLMTTDADSAVDRHWISANLAEIAAGADAVAGVVAFDAAARLQLPELPGRDLEWRLAELQAKLTWLLDPQPHDPWPNHIWSWGASLAITLEAYERIGGLPLVPLAEDRALAAAIERNDLRLRRSHAPIVYTSVRDQGRAPGGFADMLANYASDPATPCDAALEPVADLVRRLRWRAEVRQRSCSFGKTWANIEAGTPCLARRRVVPTMLKIEIAIAERLIAQLETPQDHSSLVTAG